MKPLTHELLKSLIELAGDRLTGEWLLIGGSVLPLLGVQHRVTKEGIWPHWRFCVSIGPGNLVRKLRNGP